MGKPHITWCRATKDWLCVCHHNEWHYTGIGESPSQAYSNWLMGWNAR